MRDKKVTDFLSTRDAARSLGYSIQHTRLLARHGKLQAHKFGRDWLVLRESVARYKATCLWPASPQHPRPATGVVNVASVPQRSPFRYPGGKTWLVPCVRQWLRARAKAKSELVEPFAGGGIVGLTAVFEGFVERATLVEIDEDVASVWATMLSDDAEELADRIVGFQMSLQNVRAVLAGPAQSQLDRAFATLLRNRVNRGGILAPGAGLVKSGENGKGLRSRWYPETLRRRILWINRMKDRIGFLCGDGVQVMRQNADRKDALFFVDPPYTVAGRRLYTHSDVDHGELFALARRLRGDFLITYDDSAEIRGLAYRNRMAVREILMKSTHHAKKVELLIGRDLDWHAM